MVLYPLPSKDHDPRKPPATASVSAWEAIERKQREAASEWWLVAQPDHAALSGDLAERIDSGLFPRLEPEVIEAIRLHDEGWAAFDRGEPMDNDGRPLSFLNMPPEFFLRAWTGSIERAEQVAAVAGVLVSEHFCRIGNAALGRSLPPGQSTLVLEFLQNESQRQERLRKGLSFAGNEISTLVDVLQFCDLLSLYLCCGSREGIEFPQRFHGQTIHVQPEAECYALYPQIFAGGTSLAVNARKYPAPADSSFTIPILLV